MGERLQRRPGALSRFADPLGAPARTVLRAPPRDEPEPLRVLRMLAACRYLYIGEVRGLGVGVFVARPFARGSVLVRDEDGTLFGRCLTLEQALAAGYDRADHLFQLAPDRFLPPRGCFDDLFNHSCAPTGGWMMTPLGARFVAIRDLAAGDELTYDYSTYLIDEDETLACRCDAPGCRGLVRAWRTLPAGLRERYRRLGVVHPAALANG
jgi:hypothetical protein